MHNSSKATHLLENLEKACALWPEITQLLMDSMPHPKATEQRIAAHISDAFGKFFRQLWQQESADLWQWQAEWWQQTSDLWQGQWEKFFQTSGFRIQDSGFGMQDSERSSQPSKREARSAGFGAEPHSNNNKPRAEFQTEQGDARSGGLGRQPQLNNKDRRFRSELWENNWFFDSLRQQYLLNTGNLEKIVRETSDELDSHTAHLVAFYSKQWMDTLSPSNFPWSNPEVLKLTLESDGANLVKGMENLLADLRAGRISMTDSSAFELGRNIATTPGEVVFRNDLLELIQYYPPGSGQDSGFRIQDSVRSSQPSKREAAEAVGVTGGDISPLQNKSSTYKTPLLIIPAWINKYYIMDLQAENSMVKWLTEQGFSVFVVSWVNPDAHHREIGFDEYLEKGAYAALKAVEQATGERQVNLCGYCLGGTLSACMLSWLQARGEADRVKSATFLTTLVDFSEAGDLCVFIDEPQIAAMEAKMAETGYLDGRDMAATFTMLRPVDLIWSFVVNNYLLGKTPFPFDLLYWNMDVTRMPAKMHSTYLRQMYLHNRLIQPGKLVIAGEKVDLTRIHTPSYILATKEDHIAPWQSAYAATQQYRGEIRFVLAESGHIAGVISAPGKSKYGYFIDNEGHKSRSALHPSSPQEWLKTATRQDGSWWPDWVRWMQSHSPEKTPARIPGDGKLKAIEPAPGSYVRVKS